MLASQETADTVRVRPAASRAVVSAPARLRDPLTRLPHTMEQSLGEPEHLRSFPDIMSILRQAWAEGPFSLQVAAARITAIQQERLEEVPA